MKTDNKIKSPRRETASRREFFKMTGLGAAIVGAAAAGAGAQPASAASPARDKDAGYRETAHVKRYYELAKY
ncbi:MAG: formate dehydrogenase [Proteobacteria bacterium]|nr:formate dehydrogenase [Pseudomonadota bacterium]